MKLKGVYYIFLKQLTVTLSSKQTISIKFQINL
jgi:hypothetical protein